MLRAERSPRTPISAAAMAGLILLAGMGVARAAEGTGRQDAVTVRCRLRNSVPRSGGERPDPPFSWHFRVDFRRETA